MSEQAIKTFCLGNGEIFFAGQSTAWQMDG